MLDRARSAEGAEIPLDTPAAPQWEMWFGRRISLVMMLTVLVPLLILAYGLYERVTTWLGTDPLLGRDPLWTHALLGFTGLLMAAGGLVVRDLASTVRRTAETVAATSKIEASVVAKTDQIGALMSSFSRMLETIEVQAGEINQFATRLDVAYKELESTNARLKEVSFKDEVTRLYNRRFFSIRLDEEVSRYRRFNHPVSVVLLDLDGFKAVNDELGHGVGDETLRGVAELLLKHSRGINVVCRYGGDEFAILLVETPKAGAQIYADRIRHVLATHEFPHGRRVSASFGIACLPEDVAAAAEDLIRAADEALYTAKRGGKNRVSTHDESEASLSMRSAPAAAPPGPGEGLGRLDRLVGASDTVPADAGVLVLSREGDVRTALEGLDGDAYDLIMRPAAAAPNGAVADPASLWRAGDMRLLPAASPSPAPALSPADAAALAALRDMLRARDPGTGAHSERVRIYALALAEAHGVPKSQLPDVEHGVMLHDIGKIAVPDGILLKPGPLSPDEWKIMRTHPQVGRRLIEHMPFLRGAVPVVYHHHERWDGTGYPDGLRGEDIPLGARIFAVADAFDAMTYDRPYSRAIPVSSARAEIERCAGTHFDPSVVATFLALPMECLEELRGQAIS
ncbi:MAG TPA: diguanylate cyclase [Methylomirabilota bacterium]|nr:diguanylate cyclase [Methylomirabilota bacterium]